jgi:Ca2+-binding RTX toxin-like protein
MARRGTAVTTIVGTSFGATNVFGASDLEELSGVPLGAHSANQFTMSNSDFSVTGVGSGLTYSGNHPSGGIITSLTVDWNGGSTWTGLNVSAAALWSAVAAGDINTFDSLLFGGNDTFTSALTGAGADDFAGYAGNDVFNLGSHFSPLDRIDGGSGNDTVTLNGDYAPSHEWTTFSASNFASVETVTMAAGHNYSLQADYDAVIAGQTMTFDASKLTASDVFTFDANYNAGNFILKGGAGNDSFTGGSGNDTFSGGAGSDTVAYFSSEEDLTINLSKTAAQNVGQGMGNDTYRSIENVTTGSGNDHVTGNGSDNVFSLGDGNNVANGKGGNDTIDYSTVASLTIDMSQANWVVHHDGYVDTLTSIENFIAPANGVSVIAGNRALNINGGGAQNSSLSFSDATKGLIFDFSSNTGVGQVTTGTGEHGTITGFPNLTGSNANDTLIMGTDVFWPELKSFDGGGGYDTVDFSHFPSALGAYPSLNIQLTNVEHVIGTSMNDIINAPFGPIGTVTEVDGGDGNDQLFDNYNGAIMHGDAGDDTITMSAENPNDRVDGGSGNNTLILNVGPSADAIGSGVIANIQTVDLQSYWSFFQLTIRDDNVAAGQTMTVNYAPAAGQVAASVMLDFSAATHGNYVVNTDAGADYIVAGAGNDTINSGAGNDYINISAGGNDTVHGGSGDDEILIGGSSTDHDVIDGGDGSNTINYYHATAGVTVSLGLTTAQNTIGAGTETLTSIQSLTGSEFDDTLKGTAKNDVIDGAGGNDTINMTGGGVDKVSGGDGNDVISMGGSLTAADQIDGGTGIDTVRLAGDYSAGVIFSNTTMINVEKLILGAGYNYSLTFDTDTVYAANFTVDASALGSANHLTFDGSATIDGAAYTIIGGLGADNLTGGPDRDTFVYTSPTQSTGTLYDTINNFDFSFWGDQLDVRGTIKTIEDPVQATLSTTTFNNDLAAAVSGHLVAHSAMLVTANDGTLNGQTFLVIDQNGMPGYQAGGDLVIHLTGTIGTLTTSEFI